MLYTKSHMLKTMLLGSLFVLATNLHSQNSNYSLFRSDFRADSIFIKHVDLSVKIDNIITQELSGKASYTLAPKINNLSSVEFDLMVSSFQVDSIKIGTTHLTYTPIYSSNRLKINFLPSFQTTDTLNMNIYYKGNPTTGSGNFGGFYWSSPYVFNLGVSMLDIPHPAGRFWYPCIDDFNVRSTYSYHIEVAPTNAVAAGGILDSITNNGSNKVFHFHLNKSIPSYLVSINIAPYATISKNYTTILGNSIPIKLYALPSDTMNLNLSFQRIHQIAQVYENWFGPYIWPQIGYSLVPFSSGAMEHACNIAYPKAAVGGNFEYEFLAAHELAHSWWGNNTTCETAEEMWLNEGFATYAEYIYFREMQSLQTEINEYLYSLDQVLDKAHTDDGDYYPLSGVPQTATYGTHSYTKGGLVIRSLENYLGSNLFSDGLKVVQQQRQLQSINTEQFFEILSQATGVDLSNFMNDWIKQPGFATVTLEHFNYSNGAVNFTVRQKNRAVTHPYNELKFQATFLGANRQKHTQNFTLTGLEDDFNISLPFEPKVVYLNENNAYAYATMGAQKEIKNTGTHSLIYTKASLKVNSMAGADSVFARIDNHRVGAEDNAFINNEYVIAPGRYWTLNLIGPNSFKPTLTIPVDAKTNGYEGGGIITAKDHIKIFYRKNANEPWTRWQNDSVIYYNNSTLKGSIDIYEAIPGDYVIGAYRKDVSIQGLNTLPHLHVYPNPATKHITWDGSYSMQSVKVYSTSGQLVINQTLTSNTLELKDLKSGIYSALFTDKNGKLYSSQIIIH